MNGRLILLLLVLLAPCRARADATPLPFPAANAACRQAIAAAERAHGIPSHLLAAVARVESGRRDDASGTFNPWPWTINTDGQGSFYDNKAQAVAAAVSMRARASRSIDVGCMQISLTYHPDAFPDMNTAFDPASNADYGARYLQQLYEKTNSWPRAVEMYHSATPEIGQEYGRRVYAAWPEEQKLAELTQPFPMAGSWGSPAIRPNPFGLLRQPPPHVIPLPGGGTAGGGMATGGMATGGPAGATSVGRSLDAYRAAPIRLAFHSP